MARHHRHDPPHDKHGPHDREWPRKGRYRFRVIFDITAADGKRHKHSQVLPGQSISSINDFLCTEFEGYEISWEVKWLW